MPPVRNAALRSDVTAKTVLPSLCEWTGHPSHPVGNLRYYARFGFRMAAAPASRIPARSNTVSNCWRSARSVPGVRFPGMRVSARELRIRVVVGSSHQLSARWRPHNSVYVIDDRGEIVDRYDKRLCAGDPAGETSDLAHCTPGDHESVFTIRGIRCGVLICHDYRIPELCRNCNKTGVELLFHSFHAGNISPERLAMMRAQVGRQFHSLNRGTTYPEITMPATTQAAAASSHLWISCSNSSMRASCWPAFFVRADGIVTGRLRRDRAAVLLSKLDTRQDLYDSTQAWRDRAMAGTLHSGRLVSDTRSRNRKEL